MVLLGVLLKVLLVSVVLKVLLVSSTLCSRSFPGLHFRRGRYAGAIAGTPWRSQPHFPGASAGCVYRAGLVVAYAAAIAGTP